MLFSVSTVKCFIVLSPCAGMSAAITFITPKCLKSKAILQLIDNGEGLPIATVCGGGWHLLASDGSPRLNSRTQTGGRHRRTADPAKHRGSSQERRDRNQNTPSLVETPEFLKVYRQARRDAFGQAVARLQHGTSAAATTLLKTMIDPATPASVKVRAAEAIFNHAAKAIEIEDIDARVTALEAAAANGDQRR
jgi:hypothetical protein